mmetsp:Transcript_6378/g.19290  ORF Transcript_6378/g.19290 Transcript_6378/m.19290 type:complete len:247 (+) Transcript_6378:278-1018(+)|eukprot:CAMPEP_0198734336 /NCGR_PEP_ID=MMETSP1475-20131203/51883_1 /TAXON_ID= ORGANISM="Unidentified sp., Strain CCMP1999" /NCGR_SAMPLE_ID=MMETSP1475 /ASSEMBLY_ACC=CAM_ASM_001111 /LENGTH=246 /DNA_ID=CAMNT_0044497787 /DNA_START=242 /DNA_END=982 /DNA_ORIENTATION=-
MMDTELDLEGLYMASGVDPFNSGVVGNDDLRLSFEGFPELEMDKPKDSELISTLPVSSTDSYGLDLVSVNRPMMMSTPLSMTPSSPSPLDLIHASQGADLLRNISRKDSGSSEVSSISVGEDRLNTSRSMEQKRKAPVKWSDEEEERFIEALHRYGRDWKKCAMHVGTRDANNFRSHAQKYFIRLYKHGQPVPEKVAETGEGHTLSGKPLDPNSAAARCYLNGRSYRSDLAKRHRQEYTKGTSSLG